ncbi:MAG: hypothetical protein NZ700_10870 [Gemmataceae bacterium]|nr:hypothetical protein [Gemmataceae bacterium]MDW8264698.1 hypothetical protein [Gemmataceae bacterium]
MTSLLNHLLSAELPDKAILHAPELSCRGLFPFWAAAVLALALGGGVVGLYFLEAGRISRMRRLALALLRAAALALLVFLLLRPVLVADFRGERPREIVILLDNSESMKQRDPRLTEADQRRVAIAAGRLPPAADQPSASPAEPAPPLANNPSRADLVRSVWTHPQLDLIPRLQTKGPLRGFLFGQRLLEVAGGEPGDPAVSHPFAVRLLAEYRADAAHTALADALAALLDRADVDLPAAIVVCTDGRDNASQLTVEEAARECGRRQVPLHIYGTGSSDFGNLQLRDVSLPDVVAYDDAVTVTVRWRNRGFPRGTATLTLTIDGQVMAQRELAVREGDDLREELTFTPRKDLGLPEQVTLQAAITFHGAEAITDDNLLTRPVRLVDHKVKVLVVEGTPRWEYKLLQNALLRDRRVEARFVVVEGDARALRSGPPFLASFPPSRAELFAQDVVILGDVPADYIGTERLRWLRDFVAQGGGLVVIAGRQHMPASYHGGPLDEVLPVEFDPVAFAAGEERPVAFLPELTRAGELSPMMALADTPEENGRLWRELPGLYWHYPVRKLRPGATALLVHPTAKSADQPMPLLATHFYGRGQVLFWACDESWRWRFNAGEWRFVRFWGQVIYQFGMAHALGGARRARLALERSDQTLGRATHLFARLYDPDYRPFVRERVVGRLERLDAPPGEESSVPIVLEAAPGQPGDYQALLPNDAVGRFAVTLSEPEPARLEYRVDWPPRHEREIAGLAEAELRQAARLSGGRFYREEDLATLPDMVEPRSAPFTIRREVLLWNPLAYVVFVLLVAGEWLLRKFSDLA